MAITPSAIPPRTTRSCSTSRASLPSRSWTPGTTASKDFESRPTRPLRPPRRSGGSVGLGRARPGYAPGRGGRPGIARRPANPPGQSRSRRRSRRRSPRPSPPSPDRPLEPSEPSRKPHPRDSVARCHSIEGSDGPVKLARAGHAPRVRQRMPDICRRVTACPADCLLTGETAGQALASEASEIVVSRVVPGSAGAPHSPGADEAPSRSRLVGRRPELATFQDSRERWSLLRERGSHSGGPPRSSGLSYTKGYGTSSCRCSRRPWPGRGEAGRPWPGPGGSGLA